MIPRYAVIATHNRPAELARAVAALAPQCPLIIVIDNASEPPAMPVVPGAIIHMMRDDEQPPNLSRLWNLGLDEAARLAGAWDLVDESGAYDVAIVNDDAVPPPGWFDELSGAMRKWGATAASSTPFEHGAGYVEMHGPGATPGVHNRLTGWAFVLRGEAGLRFDESMRWWCGDDDVSMQARRAGGLVHVGGYPVPNTGANSSTVGMLAEQAARDMQTFVDKWKCRPW
jgi:hypothetical protein